MNRRLVLVLAGLVLLTQLAGCIVPPLWPFDDGHRHRHGGWSHGRHRGYR